MQRFAAIVSCMALLLGGCAFKRRRSIPWDTAVLVRPTSPQPSPEAANLSADPVPDLQPEVPAFPLRLIPAKSAMRPRVAAPVPGGSPEADKPEVPMISPQLSPQESVAAQVQTSDSLNAAEKNLALVRGRNLNAVQSDLVSKIQGFLKDARDAARAGDWVRARSLAKKAQVLSEELAGSS